MTETLTHVTETLTHAKISPSSMVESAPDPMTAPDIHSSTDDYARRFAGRVGAYFLNVQTQATLRFMQPWRGGTVLDVGGGHAQLAQPLVEAGYRLSLLGSDLSCFDRAERLVGSDRIHFIAGSLMDPPVPDRSFDVATSFRIMPHIADWRRLVRGLCRVAKHAVVIDFPTSRSINALTPLLLNTKKKLEVNTRDYTLFRPGELRAAFMEAGFTHVRAYSQFFWPMVMHRAMQRPGLSRLLEAPARWTGMTALFGSPVILCATRGENGGES